MGVLDKLKERKKTGEKLTYREKNGTTRVGDFLRGVKDVAPELLTIAGKVTGLPGLELVGDLIRGDEHMSDINKQLALEELKLDMTEMQELTKRLQSDNEHPVTRLVRPISYGFILLNLALLMYFDGNIGDFEINPEYIPVIKYLSGVMTMFYFGSRGIEKVMKEFNK